MEYIAAIYRKEGRGLSFLSPTDVQGGFCTFLCEVCRDGVMDRELTEYVWKRLKYWAMGHRVSVTSGEELRQLLSKIQEEVERNIQMRREQGHVKEIRWRYLALLLCTGEFGVVATRGQGRVWVTQRNWGKVKVESLVSGDGPEVELVKLQPGVGVLLSEGHGTETRDWQQMLDPVEINSTMQIQKRIKELGEYTAMGEGNLAYLIYKGE